MMIKCAKCGFENQLGSIFCRGCGEKIDTSALDPQANGDIPGVELAKKEKKKGGARGFIFLLILLGLAGFVYMLLTTDGVPAYTPGDVAYNKSVRDLERNRSTAFTTEQMTAWFNKEILGKNTATSGGFKLNNIQFADAGNDGMLTAYIGTDLFTCPVIFTLTGSLTKGDDEKPVDFQVKELKVGRIRVPAAAMPYILEKFQPLTDVEPLKEAFASAKAVRYANGALAFDFGSLVKTGN